ncbi:MAG: WD40 repeat domain-containing serine/threonine-protein kinase [Polyangia bacterium]
MSDRGPAARSRSRRPRRPAARRGGSSAFRPDSAVAAGRSGACFSVESPASQTAASQAAASQATPSQATPSQAAASLPGEPRSHPFGLSGEVRYEPLAELGCGGMGRVVVATDRRLRRQIALKHIASAVCEQPGIEQRFAREALITAGLDHPAIVPIFDAGRRGDGSLFYTMRLIRGRTLSAAIADADGLTGRLALLRHFLVACEAVAYAHSRGVVHRDLKPDNILVGEFGETQVVDWGLARRHDEDEAEPERAELGCALRTAVGAVIGTPLYMSPEQAAGLPAEPSSDVFSLGVVLYEILAGRPPLHGRDPSVVLRAHQRGELPPLRERQPDAPRELVAIVDKALSKGPEQRYPDARALATDVARFLDGRRVTAHRYSLGQGLVRLARAWRAPLTVGAVAAVLLLVLLAWAFRRTRLERDAAIFAEARTRRALAAADLHLGRVLVEQALTAQADDRQPEAEGLAARSLVLAESAEARGVLASFARLSRPVLRERTPLPQCQTVRPLPDGRVLCVEDGTVSVWIATPRQPLRPVWQRAMRARDATWLERGQKILVSVFGNRAILFTAEGTELGTLPGFLNAPHGFGAPFEGDLAILSNADGISFVDARARAVTTQAPCGFGKHLAAALSPAGDRYAAACYDGRVHVRTREGAPVHTVQTPFTDERAGACALAFAPDGATLLVVSLEGDLASIDLQRGALRVERRFSNGIVRSIRFSPDGRRVLLIGDRGGATLFQPEPPRILRRLPAIHDRAASWSPSGTELVTAGAELRRWSVPRDLTPLHLLEQRLPGLSGASLSPRGDRLAVARGDGHVEVLDTATGALRLRDRFQSGVVKGVHFSSGGELLAWAAGEPAVRTYDTTGRVLETRSYARLRRVARLPSGWLIALGYFDRMELFDPRAPTLPAELLGEGEFFDAAQSADERTVAAINTEGEVLLIRDQPGGPRARKLLQRRGLCAVALDSDGSHLALAFDRDGEVLDTATGAVLARFSGDGRQILDVALSPDGRWLATGDLDLAARIWSVPDGRLAAVLRGHSGRVASVSFSRDSRTLITASWDGSARLWGLDVLSQPAAELLARIQADWGLDLALTDAELPEGSAVPRPASAP